MNSKPLLISQQIWCEGSEKYVELKVEQIPPETDAQTWARFELLKDGLIKSCTP